MSSKIISSVLEKFDYAGGSSKVGLLLTTFLTFLPLIFDNIFSDAVYLCPANNRHFYSLFLLMAPSICTLVIGLILTFQYLRDNVELGTRELIYKLIPRIFILLIVICITLGCSFIFSKYYLCYRMDPIIKDDNLKNEILNESHQIGWIIILSGLFIFFLVTFLQFSLLYPSKLERTWTNYKMMQLKTANDVLRSALLELATGVVQRETSNIIKQIDEIEEYDETKLTNLLLSYHSLEKHTERRGAELIQEHLKTVKSFKPDQNLLDQATQEYTEDDPLL